MTRCKLSNTEGLNMCKLYLFGLTWLTCVLKSRPYMLAQSTFEPP